MSSKILTLASLFIFTIATTLKAQKGNPYSDIGKKGETLTLTKGQFDEFFDDDDVQQIGTNLVNIRTMKIVKMLTDDDAEKRLDNTTGKRFLSVDPLTSSFPWYSPYQFAGNKPIIAVDLDGLEEYIVINYYTRMKELERTNIITLTHRNSKELVDMQMRASMGNGRLGSLEAQGKKVLVRHVFSDDNKMFADERRDVLIQNEANVLNSGYNKPVGNANPFQIEIKEGKKMVSEKDDYNVSQFNLEEKTVSFYEHQIMKPNQAYNFEPFTVEAGRIVAIPMGIADAENFAKSLKNTGIKEVIIQPEVVASTSDGPSINGKTALQNVTSNYKLLGEVIEKNSGVKVTILPAKKSPGSSTNLHVQTK